MNDKCCEKCDGKEKRGQATYLKCVHPYCPCHTENAAQEKLPSTDSAVSHAGSIAPVEEDWEEVFEAGTPHLSEFQRQDMKSFIRNLLASER